MPTTLQYSRDHRMPNKGKPTILQHALEAAFEHALCQPHTQQLGGAHGTAQSRGWGGRQAVHTSGLMRGMPNKNRGAIWHTYAPHEHNCQVHALNMACGRQVTTAEAMQQLAQDAAKDIGLQPEFFATESGRFSNCLLDRLLLQHHGCLLANVATIRPEEHLQPGHLSTRIRNLAVEHNTMAFVCNTHEHAFAIRVDEAGNCWLLDSLLQEPEHIRPLPTSYTVWALRNAPCDGGA
jgi:hypothetical protein